MVSARPGRSSHRIVGDLTTNRMVSITNRRQPVARVQVSDRCWTDLECFVGGHSQVPPRARGRACLNTAVAQAIGQRQLGQQNKPKSEQVWRDHPYREVSEANFDIQTGGLGLVTDHYSPLHLPDWLRAPTSAQFRRPNRHRFRKWTPSTSLNSLPFDGGHSQVKLRARGRACLYTAVAQAIGQ